MVAAKKKQAVFSDCYYSIKPYKPAAFVINFSGNTLFKIINSGLYIYKKDEK